MPLFSWLILRGRARCCGEPISRRYPLTELTLGVLYAATVAVLWDDRPKSPSAWSSSPLSLAVTLTDLERRIIPNKILVVAAVLGVGDRRRRRSQQPARTSDRSRWRRVALLFLIALAYPRGMGLGDVKLVAVMGLFLGRDVAPAIFVALLPAQSSALAMIAGRVSAARKRRFPSAHFWRSAV